MLFPRGYNFEFLWVLIFVGAVFRVYLKSRFIFKVIKETTRISSVIEFLWLSKFLQSFVIMKFSYWDSFFLYSDKSRYGDRNISRLTVVSGEAKEEVPCEGLSMNAREYFTRTNLVKIKNAITGEPSRLALYNSR